MYENDPRYRNTDFSGEGTMTGRTAPGRHDIARASYMAHRRDLRITDLYSGRRR